MIKITTLLLLCSLLLASPALAAGVSASSSLGKALSHMATLDGFSARFKQVLSYAEGGKRTYTGELAVLRPGKFRWHYVKPYEQLYVSNGDGVWLYEPDLMQAQKLQDLGEVDPVVMRLLDGRIGLKDVQVLQKQVEASVDAFYVQLGQGEHAVQVWLGVRENQLLWIESRDVLDNTNRLYLLEVNTIKPEPEIFEFIAPDGVDVIGA